MKAKLLYTDRTFHYVLEALGYTMDVNGMVRLPDGSIIHRDNIAGFYKNAKNGILIDGSKFAFK